jgi:hypothetical protein
MSKPGDAKAAMRAMQQPVRLFMPGESITYLCEPVRITKLYLGDGREGEPINALCHTPDGLMVWLHVSMQESPFVGFWDGDLIDPSSGRHRYVMRFALGNRYRARVCADRETGQHYLALPTDPEALSFIQWWDEQPEGAGGDEA